MSYVLDDLDRPSWFTYPSAFLRIVEQNLVDLTPWYVMDSHNVVERMKGLKQRYPTRDLIPFARRGDNDDVACFERGKGESVIVIHDFSSPGYEERAVFPSFWDWFKCAVDEMILFEP
jgi:hypothetical protein